MQEFGMVSQSPFLTASPEEEERKVLGANLIGLTVRVPDSDKKFDNERCVCHISRAAFCLNLE